MPSIKLAIETQTLCSKYLQIVRSSPTHDLDVDSQTEIFKSFGPSTVTKNEESTSANQDWYYIPVSLSFADRVFGWLAVITARKVLPVWAQFGTEEIGDENYSHDPATMLKMAEDFLLGIAETSEGKMDLCNRFHFGINGVEYQTKKQGWLAVGAAYRALEAIFQGGHDVRNPNYYDNFVVEAVGAFNTLDPNEPGLWYKAHRLEEVKWVVAELTLRKRFDEINRYRYNRLIEELAEEVKNFVPITIVTEKKLEFWTWWLTEAIPQAWEKANSLF